MRVCAPASKTPVSPLLLVGDRLLLLLFGFPFCVKIMLSAPEDELSYIGFVEACVEEVSRAPALRQLRRWRWRNRAPVAAQQGVLAGFFARHDGGDAWSVRSLVVMTTVETALK
jgi:hypothetical protein